MSFNGGFDIGLGEFKRRRKQSFSPSFTGDIDLKKLSRGQPFPTSSVFGKNQTQRNLLAQRNRLQQTPTRVKAEGNIEDAFLTNPLASPTIDPTRKSNGKRKKGKQNKRDKGRASLVNEGRRLKRGGAPRNIVEQDSFSDNDNSFRSLGV